MQRCTRPSGRVRVETAVCLGDCLCDVPLSVLTHFRSYAVPMNTLPDMLLPRREKQRSVLHSGTEACLISALSVSEGSVRLVGLFRSTDTDQQAN